MSLIDIVQVNEGPRIYPKRDVDGSLVLYPVAPLVVGFGTNRIDAHTNLVFGIPEGYKAIITPHEDLCNMCGVSVASVTVNEDIITDSYPLVIRGQVAVKARVRLITNKRIATIAPNQPIARLRVTKV